MSSGYTVELDWETVDHVVVGQLRNTWEALKGNLGNGDWVFVWGDQEADEFGQLHIDEAIVGCREVSDEEIPPLFFEDHPYLQEWGPSKAFEYVHKVKDNGTE